MSRIVQRPLAEIRFVGGRFERLGGLLEFDVFDELRRYKVILIEIAKDVWRRNNPERKKLPQGFEKGIRLAFREVHAGSSIIPIERVLELEDEDPSLLPPPDEVDEAAGIIDGTLKAAERDVRFPDGLTKRILPLFGEWGRALRADEAIELNGNEAGGPARFNPAIRDRIVSYRARGYQDRIAIVGEIREARLRTAGGGTFAIHLDNGSVVRGSFSEQQESIITEAFHRHREMRLRIEGLMGFGPNGRMKKVIEIDKMRLVPASGEEYDPTARPIWEVIEELGKSIPDEEWDKVPADTAKNFDHYLYGSPKEEP